MLVHHSKNARRADVEPKLKELLATVLDKALREWVEHISKPRHYAVEPEQNRATADWLFQFFEALGLHVSRQGPYSNIIAVPEKKFEQVILVGAHYDSVPMCPGADDNGSAVAAMMGCAAACSLWRPVLPVAFVAFNREEDGLIGSSDFVESYLSQAPFKIHSTHILEMVGFASSDPGSQRVPPGLPVKVSDKGDFLGVLANRGSKAIMDDVLRKARAYVPELPVMGLDVKLGIEKFFPVLSRSDHAPFWSKKIPAVMWTDTSEFRNYNYHRDTDTPDTLNYTFLKNVTQLLTACVVEQANLLDG